MRARIEDEIALTDALVGVRVRDLVDAIGTTLSINTDAVFPIASTVKTHFLATLLVLAETIYNRMALPDESNTNDHRACAS